MRDLIAYFRRNGIMFKIGHYQLDFLSLFKKKTPKIDDLHGIYFVTGIQGTGKTYQAVDYASRLNPDQVKIKTNIKSLKIPGVTIEYFTRITEIINDEEEHVCYVIDEVSKKYVAETRTDQPFLSWLNQSRKRKRVVILITQEWTQVPTWLRKPVKFVISTRPAPIVGILMGLYMTTWSDGQNLTVDPQGFTWIGPVVRVVFHKRNIEVASLYDTYEPIPTL